MGCDPRSGDAIRPHLVPEEADQRLLLLGIEPLLIVVSEHDDAQIALILRPHMGTLPCQWPTGPNTSRRINGEVVADIAKWLGSAAKVRASDRLEPAACGRAGGVGKDRHTVVVDGDSSNRRHWVHAVWLGAALGP